MNVYSDNLKRLQNAVIYPQTRSVENHLPIIADKTQRLFLQISIPILILY